MKYHYQEGVIEKDKKGHKKAWLGFFMLFALITYGGFSFATLALNGYPLEKIDSTAKVVKDTKPGSLGDRLFIPAINVNASIDNSLKQSGDPTNNSVTLTGEQLGFGATPDGLRSASPFFNLDKLRNNDEIFLDNNSTRYVYKIVKSSDSSKKLTLKSQGKSIVAEGVGTIAWNHGSAKLQTF